ncbi:hypothetical protein SAMN05421820_104234 [Pedobacter steynii]|uniref:Uncharacterized protein n=1 Tax=Pedobacter steynii TaxID=430522 RepID=A0A1G9UP40_9SPHI|nr:hypothetical protein [Pedobacter steynii]NQX40830.1 hypothetical protein [Pedobacter steynii]SDM61708.1 hypothetical protein SAMN05421820_104234 [Pedobacter steynii]
MGLLTQELDLVSGMISDLEQLDYLVLRQKGHLLIYPGQELGSDCICLIYHQDFLQHHIDFNQPVHYIVVGKEVNLLDWGVPGELVSNFEYPFFERMHHYPLKVNKRYPSKIFYVLDDVADEKNATICLSVIKSFNLLLHLEFCCVVPDALIPLLEQVANDHITLLKNTEDYSSFFPECELLIGSESAAANGLLSNIPVIVAGKQGFGGLVTADNLISFLPNRFSGRPGGHPGERISPLLLVQEMMYVLEVMNTKELDDLLDFSDHSIGRMKAFSREYIFDSIKRTISEKYLLSIHIHDDVLMRQVKPRLSSAIVIDKLELISGEIFCLRNVNTNKMLAEITDFEAKLILQCNGENRVSDLLLMSGKEEDINEPLEFLRSLWELRAIHFQR